MIWKALVFAFFAISVLAEEVHITDEQHQQLKDYLKTACRANGAEDKTDEVENAGKNFIDCVKGLFDAETLKREIEEAKPNGALDEVFKKYCDKSPQLKSCIHTLSAAVSPCLSAQHREHIPAVNNATDQLIDFVCYKDGDRIALFIAEGGPECFQEKATSIRECANKLKDNISSIEAAKKLTLNEQCGKFDELTSCTVKELEGCSTPTPANMAESLFRFIRKGSPCKSVTKN